ncbi:uncharacterized protein LOC134268109 [Saccostrea cucullata]|uniref:uncharacterized protein LOC134268109 n=1 Tax=Saccostrea cuccullata TaxID=36930 RepID=UPI002ED41530
MVYNDSAECPLFPENPGYCDVIIHVRRAIASLSLIGSLFVIVVIWLFKKHAVFSQRLILYLSIAAFFYSTAYLMGDIRPDGPMCDFQAWYLSYFVWSALIWVCIITFNLYMNVVKNRSIEKFEILFHILGWVFSAIMSFLPLAGNRYGPAGAWCWIVNDLGWRFGVWYGPLFIAITVLVVTYVYIIVTLFRRLSTWKGTYDPEKERQTAMLKDDIKYLRAYPFVYLAVSVFSLIDRIQNAASPGEPVFALVILAALTAPLHGAMNAIVFGMDRETLRRLTPTQIKMAFMARITKKAEVHELSSITSISAGEIRHV